MAASFRDRALRGSFLLSLVTAAGRRLGFARSIMRGSTRRMFAEKTKARAFAGYAPSEGDVFVATFGKSGTNWMMQIAQQTAWHGRAEFDHIHDVVPWPDAPFPAAVGLDDPGPRTRAPTALRVVKTHLDAEYVPYDERSVYLTVIRDPKEVLVSSYYFLGGMFGMLDFLSMEDWFELYLEPGSVSREWALHTDSFWRWRDRPNVLVLTYGEMKRDLARQVDRVAQVMGVELTSSARDAVLERASFDWMYAHESQFAPPRPPFRREEDATRMVRAGETGRSGRDLTPEQQDAIDCRALEELEELGSAFPYARLFCGEDKSA